jgi:hypothetical protein
MTDILFIWNRAITLCGGELLATVEDECKARRLCEQFHDHAVKVSLESGAWKNFMRTVELSADPDFTVEFGYACAFEVPEDWRRTYVVSATPALEGAPLDDFHEEGGVLYANSDKLYCRYVSDGPEHGGDLGRWTALFVEAVASKLAELICLALTESESKVERIEKHSRRALRTAKSHDAFKEGVKRPPPGRLVTARIGRVR